MNGLLIDWGSRGRGYYLSEVIGESNTVIEGKTLNHNITAISEYFEICGKGETRENRLNNMREK